MPDAAYGRTSGLETVLAPVDAHGAVTLREALIKKGLLHSADAAATIRGRMIEMHWISRSELRRARRPVARRRKTTGLQA